jgi:Arc/MetJ family transcription regulator
MMIGAVMARDQVRIDELVAALAMRAFEADREGGQAMLAHLAEQPNDQAGIDAADSSTPTGTSATMRRSTAVRRAAGVAPPTRLGQRLGAAERRVPIHRSLNVPSSS